MCCYGFSQYQKSLYNTAVYVIKEFISPTNKLRLLHWIKVWNMWTLVLILDQYNLGAQLGKIVLKNSFWSRRVGKRVTAKKSSVYVAGLWSSYAVLCAQRCTISSRARVTKLAEKTSVWTEVKFVGLSMYAFVSNTMTLLHYISTINCLNHSIMPSPLSPGHSSSVS